MSTPPLSSLCPTWTGTLPAARFTALQRGIARERERFHGKPFVLVRLLDGSDFDGFKTELELLGGFPDEAPALHEALAQAEAALTRALAEPAALGTRWTLVAPLKTAAVREPLSPAVERLALTQFQVKDHTGLLVERHVFMVLHVRAAEIVGPELFAAVGWAEEFQRFLLERGDTPERS